MYNAIGLLVTYAKHSGTFENSADSKSHSDSTFRRIQERRDMRTDGISEAVAEHLFTKFDLRV